MPSNGQLRTSAALGVASATAGAVLWGFSGCCAQYLFEHSSITASFLTMARAFGAGALFLVVLAVRYRQELRRMVSKASTLGAVLLFGLAVFGSQFTYAMSIDWTNAGTATVLQMSGSVFVMVVSCAIGRMLPRAGEFIGLLCALAGTWLIATQGDLGAIHLPWQGLAWGLANGLTVMFYIMWPKRLYAEFGSVAPIGVAMVCCGVIAWVVWLAQGMLALGFGDAQAVLAIPDMGADCWLVLGVIAVFGTFGAFGLYLYGVSKAGSITGSLLGAFEPLGAMVISAVWLATPLSAADWAGFGLMCAMLVLVTVSPGSAKE